ncbi:MAG TPA: hypothetical protein PK784_00420 [Tenuifilaceae bacterium]|nr:hypothetical protein CYCD_30970 [Tenuifilaceae bacterium CYCD]HOZ13224.1 hypothetical protein [Tenuifilaceae bacterium]HPN22459.1 hypothetical protein [Tenuifilaceae bacterium]HPV55841.1 hypothetical protein [Tenuifilaceae bacterium]
MSQEITNIFLAVSSVAITITFVLSYFQFRYQSKVTNAANHLKIREMFGIESLRMVHGKLRKNNTWEPSSEEEWSMVDDYLGLFEVCEKLLQDRTLDEKLFASSYEYRLQNIVANNVVVEKIRSEKESWSTFLKLLKRYKIDF